MLYDVQNLTKLYRHRSGSVVHALSNVSVRIEKGQFVTITGPSGSGKSTLLFTLGGLLRPTSGSIAFQGTSLHNSDDGRLSEYRKRYLGYVMQNFFLIPYLTAEENVMVAVALTQKDRSVQRTTARDLLSTVGLSDRAKHYPRELSSGQQQRVAIARAIANSPSVILADEPTGNLDPELSAEILRVLSDLNREREITVIMVTHNPESERYGSHRIHLRNGRMTEAA